MLEVMHLTTYAFFCNFVEHKSVYTTDQAAISKRIGRDINVLTSKLKIWDKGTMEAMK